MAEASDVPAEKLATRLNMEWLLERVEAARDALENAYHGCSFRDTQLESEVLAEKVLLGDVLQMLEANRHRLDAAQDLETALAELLSILESRAADLEAEAREVLKKFGMTISKRPAIEMVRAQAALAKARGEVPQ